MDRKIGGCYLRSKLGRGPTGTVAYVVEDSSNGDLYVLKTFPKDFIMKDLEVLFNKDLSCPNLIRYSHLLEGKHLFMEYGEKGNLDCWIRSHDHINQAEFLRILKKTVEGVSFLHKHKIVHGNIKPENILLDFECEIKVADWLGLSESHHARNPNRDTLGFIPAELLLDPTIPVSSVSDVFAIGCTMFYAAMKCHPFGSFVSDYNNNILQEKMTPFDQPGYTPEVKRMLLKMIDREPRNRPTLDELLRFCTSVTVPSQIQERVQGHAQKQTQVYVQEGHGAGTNTNTRGGTNRSPHLPHHTCTNAAHPSSDTTNRRAPSPFTGARTGTSVGPYRSIGANIATSAVATSTGTGTSSGTHGDGGAQVSAGTSPQHYRRRDYLRIDTHSDADVQVGSNTRAGTSQHHCRRRKHLRIGTGEDIATNTISDTGTGTGTSINKSTATGTSSDTHGVANTQARSDTSAGTSLHDSRLRDDYYLRTEAEIDARMCAGIGIGITKSTATDTSSATHCGAGAQAWSEANVGTSPHRFNHHIHLHTDAYTSTDTDTGIGAGRTGRTVTDTDAGAGADTGICVGAGADMDVGVGTNTSIGAKTDTDRDAGTHANVDIGTGTSTGTGADAGLLGAGEVDFIPHPETDKFNADVVVERNEGKEVVKWGRWGYAITNRLFGSKIWRMDFKMKKIGNVVWLGILVCDEIDYGNVHDRTRLCVFQSSGLCGQSGFSYGNTPWKVGDEIGLEIDLVGLTGTTTNISTDTPSAATSSSSSSSSSFPSPSSSTPASSATALSASPHTNTSLRFFQNGMEQPVSYVHVPAPVRFVLYSNDGDTECEILRIREVSPQEKEKEKERGEKAIAPVYSPDGYKNLARVVPWNTTSTRMDR